MGNAGCGRKDNFHGSHHPEVIQMDHKAPLDKDKIIPERMAVLKSLPVEVKQQLTGEEAQAFLYGEELPPGLAEKLKDYLVDEDT